MSHRRTRGSTGRDPTEPEPARERQRVEESPAQVDETSRLVDYLTGLEPGTRLAVQRTSPTYAKGWLEDLTITPDVVDNLRDYLRQNYGGGTFVLQARKRTSQGLQFARGTASVDIAGEPTLHGRRYIGGVLQDPPQQQPPQQPQPQPIVLPAMTSGGGDPNVVQALLQLSTALGQLQAAGQGRGDLNLDAVANLVGALQRQLPGAQAADPFGNLERTVSFLGKLRNVFDRDDDDGGGGGGGGVPASPFGGQGGSAIENMITAKLFGDGMFGGMQGMQGMPPGAAPQQYPPQWNGQQWVRPVWNGHTWAWVPSQPPGPPGPPGPPPAAAPQASQAPPQAGPAGPAPASPAAASSPAAAEQGDDDDDPGPLTPDDVLDELADMAPDEQARWFASLAERLPSHVQGALLQHVSGMMPQHPSGGFVIDLPAGKPKAGGS